MARIVDDDDDVSGGWNRHANEMIERRTMPPDISVGLSRDIWRGDRGLGARRDYSDRVALWMRRGVGAVVSTRISIIRRTAR